MGYVAFCVINLSK